MRAAAFSRHFDSLVAATPSEAVVKGCSQQSSSAPLRSPPDITISLYWPMAFTTRLEGEYFHATRIRHGTCTSRKFTHIRFLSKPHASAIRPSLRRQRLITKYMPAPRSAACAPAAGNAALSYAARHYARRISDGQDGRDSSSRRRAGSGEGLKLAIEFPLATRGR